MKKALISRILAITMAITMVSGIVISSNYKQAYKQVMLEAAAYEEENKGEVTGYCYVENCLFPAHGGVSIVQTPYENGIDPNGDPASHWNSIAMDIVPDNGIFYAPFTGSIVGFNPNDCNEFIYQSKNKVLWADGTLDYVSIYILHSADVSVIEYNLNSGTIVPQNEAIYSPDRTSAISIGGAASASDLYHYPAHFDIQIKRGRINSFASAGHLNGEILHYNVFNINPEYTTLNEYSSMNRAFNIPADKDRFEGRWQERGAFPESRNTSKLKVSCDSSLAFEHDEEYSLFDYLIGKNIIGEEVSRLATIINIVNNYANLDYDGLTEFERRIYDNCHYEVVPDIEPVQEETEPEPTEPTTITITFDTGGIGEIDETQRQIILGTCSSTPFPIPRSGLSNATFLGWYRGEEKIDNNSLLKENTTLTAKWSTIEVPTNAPIESPTEEQSEIVVEQQTFSAPYVKPEPEPAPPVPEPVQPVVAQNISLNRTTKMLSTDPASNSRSFELIAEVLPLDAVDRSVILVSSDPNIACVNGNTITAMHDGSCTISAFCGNVSASCEVTVKTAYNTSYGAWSSYSKTPVSPSSNIEVDSLNFTRHEIERYRCVYYCCKDLDGNRVYFSSSRNGDYTGLSWQYTEWSFAKQLEDESHDYWDYAPSELGNPIDPGCYYDSNQGGYNGSNVCLFPAKWGNDEILVAIKEPLYKEVTETMYRYRSIIKTPVEYD